MEESETKPVGRGRRCGREEIWGKMVGAMEVVAPLYMMGRFEHVHEHVLPHDRGLACAHVYAAPLVSVIGDPV